mgnify:CR=1 FL=1
MIRELGRRRVLQIAAGSAGAFLIPSRVHAVETPLNVTGTNVEVRLLSVSPSTLRIIVEEVKKSSVVHSGTRSDGALVSEALGAIVTTLSLSLIHISEPTRQAKRWYVYQSIVVFD